MVAMCSPGSAFLSRRCLSGWRNLPRRSGRSEDTMSRDPTGQLVEKEFLILPFWDQLGADMAGAVARAVERCLPEPWQFVRTEWHGCGDQMRWVAFFDWNGTVFALIPGGDAELGW